MQEVLLLSLPEVLGLKVHLCGSSADAISKLVVPTEQHVCISVSWTPTQTSTLHDSLQLQWKKTRLQIVLSGKATAPPQSALMHAAVKRTVSDISNTPFEAGFALPHTPTGQKVVKSQRVGGISPGHPTFEAALRNSTAATPSRRRAAEDTPGLSRYALEAAPGALALPAAQFRFADRLTEVANSPQPVPPKRPQVRLKRSAGAVPLRSLRLSVNQQPDAMPAQAVLTKPAAVRGKTVEAAGRGGSSRKAGPVATKGFSFFHSEYVCIQIYLTAACSPMEKCLALTFAQKKSSLSTADQHALSCGSAFPAQWV